MVNPSMAISAVQSGLSLSLQWSLLSREFPGGPVVKPFPSNATCNAGWNPDQEAKILYASWQQNQNIKQKQYCNKFNKDSTNGLHTHKICWAAKDSGTTLHGPLQPPPCHAWMNKSKRKIYFCYSVTSSFLTFAEAAMSEMNKLWGVHSG